MQLQGRYNNPFSYSGYNYRSTVDAARTIVRQEGFSALFYGYKATIFRDLPFSALQFAFYEQEQQWAREWVGGREIGLPLEILTASSAGGLAGVITCPLDVVKTRIQTQLNPLEDSGPSTKTSELRLHPAKPPVPKGFPRPSVPPGATRKQTRLISTSSPSTSVAKPGSVNLDTSSIFTGLKLIYRTEGIAGWFRGVGPRFVWTSVQSGTMLVLYQTLLRQLDQLATDAEDGSMIV